MRWLIGLAIVLAACGPRAEAPASASPSDLATPAPTPSPTATPIPTSSPTPLRQPSAASGGLEVFATGRLRGTYVWVVSEEPAPQDRVSESLYAVPVDGSAATLVVRRLRARMGAFVGGYATTNFLPERQITRDGTRLILEQSPLGPAAHDGLVVVDLVAGKIGEIARGDQRNDILPAWSPDGKRIAFMRFNIGATPVTRDDGLWVIDADGSNARQLQPPARFAQVTYTFGWTADSRGVAFGLAFEGLNYSVVDVTTGTVSGWQGNVFGLAPASWRLRTPQLAIAFSEGDKGGTQSIRVADGIGAPARVIASEPPAEQGLPVYLSARWSPIADEILFVRLARPTTLMRVSLAGGGSRQVKTDGEPVHVEWLPDGRIAYTTTTALATTDGSRVTTLWTPPAGVATDLAIRTYP